MLGEFLMNRYNIGNGSYIDEFTPSSEETCLFMNSNYLDEIKAFFNILKSHFDKLFSYFKHIKNNIQEIISEMYKISIKEIKSELFFIASKLKESSYFNEEFLDFLRIKEMIEYIIDNGLNKNFEFAESLLNKFSKLLYNKVNFNNYAEYYVGFSNELDSDEEFFYTEIYVPSHEYDETIVKITNILE